VPIGDHTRAIPPANPSLALAFPVIAYAPAHAIALDASVCSNDVWTVDCGATRHFVGSEKELTRVTDTAPRVTVQVASGTMSSATNEGDIVRTAETPDGPVTVTLTGVLVVPGFVHNLLSCCYAFEHDGIRTELNDARRLVLPSGRDVPFLDDQHRYLVSLATPSGGGDAAPAQACTTDLATPPDEIIHARLAHFGISRLRKAVGKIKGINLSAFKGHEDCEQCAKGGFRSARFTKQTRQNPPTFAYFGECVTSDLAGPFPPSTPSHFQYAIIFFDRYSKYISVYYMQTKRSEEVKACLEQFISDHRSWLKNGGVTEWFTDNGGEFRSKDLDAFCHELAIKRGFSVPYKSNTNHTAERAWGILLRPTRIIANSQEGVSKWWPFIMEQVRLVHIALPTGTDEAPLLKARPNSSQPPDLSMFRVMLCRCIARISKVPDHMKDTAHKLSPLGYECAYLGFDPSRKAHRVYALHLNLITYVVDKETKFYENEFPHWKDEGDHAITFKYIDSNELPAPDSTLRYQPDVQPQPRARPTPVATPPPHQAEAIPWGDSTQPNIDLLATQMFSPPPENANVVQLDKDLVHLDTSTKVGVASSDLTGEVALVSLTDTEPIPIPKTYKEAVEGPWADKWLDAMKEDLEGKARNNMSKKVPHDGKRPLMKGKWVYTIKYNPDGSIKKFKARWVAKGYSQIEGLHYNETFSSTMRAASTRLLLASSVGIDDFTNKPKQRKHVDVDKAFTHSDIDCDIEMEQPHGFAVPGMADLLLKALEGTKQGGHLWQELSSTKMRNFGMTQSTIDPNLFYKKEGNEWIRVGVFVDDILAVFNTTAIFTRFLTHYKNTEPKITCHDEGEVNQFTGLEVTTSKDNLTLSISQSRYIENMYKQYCAGENMIKWTSPVGSTRAELDRFMNIKGAQTESERTEAAGKNYLGVIGSLLYAACSTRPDIQYHVSHLSQFMSNPSIEAYNAAIGIVCYLYRTKDQRITYSADIQQPPVEHHPIGDPVDPNIITLAGGLHVYTDASFARDQDLCSVAGFVVMFHNGAISWGSKKIRVKCKSTTEAETWGAKQATEETIYIKNIASEIGLDLPGPTPLLIDSSGTHGYTVHQSAKQRTKYFDIWTASIREAYRMRHISIHLITTKTMVADALTKALPRGELIRYREVMMGNTPTAPEKRGSDTEDETTTPSIDEQIEI
jgi:hypothetical protein